MKNTNVITRFFIQFLAIASLLLSSFTAHAAFAMFLQLDGIEGEATDKAHLGWIEMLSLTESMSVPIVISTGDTGTDKVNIQGINITKPIDQSSPLLRMNLVSGAHIASAKIEIVKTGTDVEEPHTLFIIDLADVLITSISMSASAGEAIPTENLSLNFGQIIWTYKPDSTSGGGGKSSSVGWDLATNTSL